MRTMGCQNSDVLSVGGAREVFALYGCRLPFDQNCAFLMSCVSLPFVNVRYTNTGMYERQNERDKEIICISLEHWKAREHRLHPKLDQRQTNYRCVTISLKDRKRIILHSLPNASLYFWAQMNFLDGWNRPIDGWNITSGETVQPQARIVKLTFTRTGIYHTKNMRTIFFSRLSL